MKKQSRTEVWSLAAVVCLASFALATVLGAVGCERAPNAAEVNPAANPASEAAVGQEVVQLEIDFGGRSENKTIQVPWQENSTVFSILSRASELDQLKLTSRGSGETAFIISIDGIENEGAGGDNWIFRVNGEVGKVGAGAQSVGLNDAIRWTIGKHDFGSGE